MTHSVIKSKDESGAYVFKVNLAGLNKDDLALTVTDDRLLVDIKADSPFTKPGKYYTPLPDWADRDQVNAEMTNGMLTVTIPRKVSYTRGITLN